MSEWTELHLVPPVAANLARLGWTPAHPRVREVTASTARGQSATVVAPPSPAWAGPALAGLLSRLAAERSGVLLVACPAEAVAEWGAAVADLAEGSGLRIIAARGAARAARLLREGAADVLVAGPDTILTLQARSALPLGSLAALALVWPEQWASDEILSPLMQDLPKDTQRLIIGTEASTVASLGERFARRAVTAGPPPAAATAGPVRTVSVSWERRISVIPEIVEALDPAALVVWTADRRLHGGLEAALAGVAPGAQVVTEVPEAADGTIVAVDLPDATALAGLLAAGDVVLLVPPGADRWLPGVAAPRRPLALPGLLEGLTEEVRRRRRTIAAAVEQGDLSEAALALAPLLERHEAPAVAAALYQLWVRKEPLPAPVAGSGAPTARVWIGAGQRDGIGPNDLMALLTREGGVDRAAIGRIEVRESYALVEVPEGEAERIAGQVSGRTLRNRRLAARVDRGPAPGRPAPSARGRRS